MNISLYLSFNEVTADLRRYHAKKLTDDEIVAINRKILINREITAPMIKQKLKLNVSLRTIQRWIKKLGVYLFNLKQINLETLNIFVKAGPGKKQILPTVVSSMKIMSSNFSSCNMHIIAYA